MEYGCAVAGAKVILVMGHTRCGAVNATVEQVASGDNSGTEALANLSSITAPIADCVHAECQEHSCSASGDTEFVERITERNVRRSMADILTGSRCLRQLVEDGKVLLAGAIYEVETGKVRMLD